MNILVIDDDEKIRDSLEESLTMNNHRVFKAEDGIHGLEFFEKEKIDVCFLDVWMPNMGGIEILKKIKDQYPGVEIIMISGEAKIDHAVKATKIGAYDFIEKPLSLKDILLTIEKIARQKQKKGKSINYDSSRVDMLIGESSQVKVVKELIENSAKSDARILITGENGTGKEIVAREIHLKSNRKDKPFVGVNCAAIPENLIESELFGHIKGSFTGATSDRTGKFELANEGTLFLDEVVDMSLSTQAKVLRVLQEMKITKIGSSETIRIDVRIISATNKDIKEEIKNGNFREDLYYRLNVIPIYMPALRERKDDIPQFIDYFMKTISEENNKEQKILSKEALDYMMEYSWPGNVRQLRNIIERLNIMILSNSITLDDVKQYIDDESIRDYSIDVNDKYQDYVLSVAREEFEKDFIEKKLKENKFNISKAAKALGLYPSNLHSKINKLGINIEKLKSK